MKTLFDQLTESAYIALQEYAVLYPNLTEKIITDLKSNYSWLDIKTYTSVQLCEMNGLNFDIVNINSNFNK
jgi:hypothetical protein